MAFLDFNGLVQCWENPLESDCFVPLKSGLGLTSPTLDQWKITRTSRSFFFLSSGLPEMAHAYVKQQT